MKSGRTIRVGRHLPTSGGLKNTLRLAREQGLESVQIFVSNPQGWAVPNGPRPDAELFVEGARGMGLDPVVVHAKYLINLASPNPESRTRSAEALAAELNAAASVGARFVVVHAGSHGGDGEEAGMERLVEGLKRARDIAGAGAAEPLVENGVGAGTQLCSSFEALAAVAGEAEVGVCVDTAHAFAAGYDLSTPARAKGVGEELGAALGGALAVLHLNDARNGLGSRRDGHARLGEGQVPKASWRAFFRALSGLAPRVSAVMETPYGTPEVDVEQVRIAKRLAGGLPLRSGGV